jgi:hypothetical protein
MSLAVGLAAAGCGGTVRENEQISPSFPGSRFKTIAVIAGADSRPDLYMSAGVREELIKNGLNAVRRAGRWESEGDAVSGICMDPTIEGVLIVHYNRLLLRACPGGEAAYEIQGGELGLPGMTKRLIKYLGAPAPAAGVEQPN